MLSPPKAKAATLPPGLPGLPGEGLPPGPLSSPARGKKSNSSPIHRFKVFLTRGKGKHSNGREIKGEELSAERKFNFAITYSIDFVGYQ